MTGPFTLPAIRNGAAAEGIRLMPRRCACPWAGPFPGARPVTWRRTGTEDGCPVHGSGARERRTRKNLRGGA